MVSRVGNRHSQFYESFFTVADKPDRDAFYPMNRDGGDGLLLNFKLWTICLMTFQSRTLFILEMK